MTFASTKRAAQPTQSTAPKKPRASRKPTIVEDATERSFEERVHDTHSNFTEAFSFISEVKHPILGAVLNLVTTVFGVYTGIQAAAWLGIGAAVMTGSLFIGYVVAFIAGFILAIQALRAGSAVGMYVATGQFETDYQRAKGWVSAKFSGITKRSVAQGA